MIIFGGGQADGFAFNPLFDDVWILYCANDQGCGPDEPKWKLIGQTTPRPAGREGHGAFYKETTNEMFVFGGGNNGIMSVPNDLWVLQNANGLGGPAAWVPLLQAGDVPGRIEHFAAGYDPTSNRLTIAGGCCVSPSGYTNASWVLALSGPSGIPQSPTNLNVWTKLSPGGVLPPIGDALVFGYNQVSNRLIVHGIRPGGGSNATWVLKDANAVGPTPTWTDIIPQGALGSPPENMIPTGSAYNPVTNKLIYALNRADPLGNLIPEVWVLSNADGNPPFIWPISPDRRIDITQTYAEFDDGSLGKHHTGLDIQAPSGTKVRAPAAGIARTLNMDPTNPDPTKQDNHCMGNVVILDHSFGRDPAGPFTLYAHLEQIVILDQSIVTQGQQIGTVGNTGAGRVPQCPAHLGFHLHFEVKKLNALGDLPDGSPDTSFGYTVPHPDLRGFQDPVVLIHSAGALSPTLRVRISSSGVRLRVGPGGSNGPGASDTYRDIIPFDTTKEYEAFRKSARTDNPSCAGGWLQIQNINIQSPSDYFVDSSESGKGVPRIRDGWVCADLTAPAPPNQPPMASAGQDQTVLAASAAGAVVMLDGSASSDSDSDPLRYNWTGPFGTLTGATISPTLPIGTSTVTLTVDDGRGGIASDAAVVTVNVGQPRLSARVAGKGVLPTGVRFYNLEFANIGSGHARNIVITGVGPFRTLSGSGSVAFAGTLPLNVGNLDVGASTTVRIFLNVPSTVTRFSMTESIVVEDVIRTAYRLSLSQGVFR